MKENKWRYRLPPYVAIGSFLCFIALMLSILAIHPDVTQRVILRGYAMVFFVLAYVAGFTFLFDTARHGVRGWEQRAGLSPRRDRKGRRGKTI